MQRVHLSQPAFSRSIQTLERRAGLQLFDRKGGDVRPTAAGEFLIERARRLAPIEVKPMLARQMGVAHDALASPALECDDVNTLIALALATDTVLVASDVAVQSERAAGTLRRIEVPSFPDTYIEMGIISLHKRTVSPMAQHITLAFPQLVA